MQHASRVEVTVNGRAVSLEGADGSLLSFLRELLGLKGAKPGDEFPVHRIYCVGRNYVDHAIEMGATGREPPRTSGHWPTRANFWALS